MTTTRKKLSLLALVALIPLVLLALTGGLFPPPPQVPSLVFSSAVASATTDTSEDSLAALTIPANQLGANGFIRIYTLWSGTNNANSKVIRIRYSGPSGVQYLTFDMANAASFKTMTLIQNRGVTNAQIGPAADAPGFGGTASVPVTSSVNTTLASGIVMTGQKAVGGDALTLEAYVVEVFQAN